MKSTRTKTTTFRKKGKHITDSERQIIEKLYRKGVPIPQIAALLEVHRSTIYRELQRGRVMEQMKNGARKRNLIALREALDPIELQENIQKSLKRLFHIMKPESIL